MIKFFFPLKIIYFTFLTSIFFSPLSAKLLVPSGAEILYLGTSPPTMALGGAVSTEQENFDGLSSNPLKISKFLNSRINLSYLGFSKDLLNITGSYTFSTIYGMFSFLYQHLNAKTLELGELNSIQFIFAKEISKTYAIGFKLTTEKFSGVKTTDNNSDLYGFHGDININITTKDIVLSKHYSLEKPRFGFHLKNLGYIATYQGTNHRPYFARTPELRIGGSIDLFNLSDAFKSRIFSDLALYPINITFGFMAGIRFAYDLPPTLPLLERLELSAGYLLSNETVGIPNLSPFTAGAGIFLKLWGFGLGLKYAWIPESTQEKRNHHILSLQFRLLSKDRNAPKINIESEFGTTELIEEAKTSE